MKKIFFVLGIAFLLQSCFSYKRIALEPSKMVSGQKYKIEQNHKFSKVTFNRISDSSIIVSKYWKEEQIPLKEITGIKRRKFSVVKTIALVPATAASAVLIFAISYTKINLGEVQWPN